MYVWLLSGGCSMPPFFSQLPIGCISEESTRRQKSFLLSDPSNRSRRREPIRPTTVAIQVDVVLRGSWASSFIPVLNSLIGGAGLYVKMTDKCELWSGTTTVREIKRNHVYLSEARRWCSDCTHFFQVFLPTEMSWRKMKSKYITSAYHKLLLRSLPCCFGL